MTTREPGASEVFTQGLEESPRALALRASKPAATSTAGLEVFEDNLSSLKKKFASACSEPMIWRVVGLHCDCDDVLVVDLGGTGAAGDFGGI